jgi:hypothetical protein
VLHGTPSTIGLMSVLTTSAAAKTMTNTSTNNEAIKKEDLAAMFESFIKVFQQQTTDAKALRPSQPRGMNTGECMFCSLLHYICDCATAQEYIKGGKCKRNDKGKVVLPNRLCSAVQYTRSLVKR